MCKSLVKYTASMMALILLLTACAGQKKRKMETPADADEWMTAFVGEHPETLDGVWQMSEQMESAVASAGGIGGLAEQIGTFGTAEKIFPAYEGELAGCKVFYVPCVFSDMSVDLGLIVQDGAIAEILIGAYTGDKKE